MYNKNIRNLENIEKKLLNLEVDLHQLKIPPNFEDIEYRIKNAKELIAGIFSSDIEKQKILGHIDILRETLNSVDKYVQHYLNLEVMKVYKHILFYKGFIDKNSSDLPETNYLVDNYDRLLYLRNNQLDFQDFRESFDLVKIKFHGKEHRLIIPEKNKNFIELIKEQAKSAENSDYTYDFEDQLRQILPGSEKEYSPNLEYLFFDRNCYNIEITETGLEEIPERITDINISWKDKISVDPKHVEEIGKDLIPIYTNTNQYSGNKKEKESSLAYSLKTHKLYMINHSVSKTDEHYLQELVFELI